MREKFFDVNKFEEFYFTKDIDVQSKHISDWLNCSIRLVQKWGIKNNVPFNRIHGRKYYIWDWEVIENFSEWYNREPKKRKESYYVPKPRKPPKPKTKKEKKIISFTTIKDIVDEVVIFNKQGKQQENSTKIRHFQRWCKRHKIPFEYVNGRKYYIITEETKLRMIETFKKPDFLYHLFTKEDGEKKRKRYRNYSRGLFGSMVEYDSDNN